MSDSKASKANGRHSLGTAGRVRRGNKKTSSKRNRNGKFKTYPATKEEYYGR